MANEETAPPEQSPERTTWKYAQIDTVTGKCVTVSFLSGEVIAENMILLTDEQNVNPRDIYDGVADTWTPGPPPLPPGPSQIDLIGQQLVERELAEMDLRSQNELLGSQIVDLDLRLLGGGL